MVNSFNSYLSEQEGLEPYNVVCYYQSDKIRDVVEKVHIDLMKNFAKYGIFF